MQYNDIFNACINLATIFFLRYGQSDGGIKVKNKEKNDLV